MAESKATSGFGTLLQRGDGGIGAGTQASRTVGTSNQQIIFRAKTPGVAGNSKTVSIAVSGNSTVFSMTVSESAIAIVSATDGSAAATTTVNELLYQLMQNDTFAEHWEATRGAGNGTGVLVAQASAALTSGAEGTEIFTTVAEVTSLDGPGRSRDLIDTTHMESPGGYREQVAALKDGGDVTFSINYLPGDATQSVLTDDFESGVKRNFRIVWSDEAQSTDQFKAFVMDFHPTAPLDDKLAADVTLKVSGPVTRL